MSKILRFHGHEGTTGIIDPPGGLTFKPWRLAQLPGEYELPFSISLEAVKGHSTDQFATGSVVPLVNEEPDSWEHVWIQISPSGDLTKWVSISPSHSLLSDLEPLARPTISRFLISSAEFKKFDFESYANDSTAITSSFGDLPIGTKYKIRILAPCHTPGFDEYAFKNIKVTHITPGQWEESPIDRDNQFVSHQIPRSDLNYSWVRKSAKRSITPENKSVYQFSKD